MKITTKTPNNPKNQQKSKWRRYKFPSRPEVFEALAIWMAYPKSTRKPKTQGEFAILHEVSPDTLSDYKKKPEFWKKVAENKETLKQKIADSILLDKIFKDLKQ